VDLVGKKGTIKAMTLHGRDQDVALLVVRTSSGERVFCYPEEIRIIKLWGSNPIQFSKAEGPGPIISRLLQL
jgi:hypothetical protein